MNNEIVITALTLVIFPLILYVAKDLYNRKFKNKEKESPKLEYHNLLQNYFPRKLSYLNNEFNLQDKGRTILIRIVLRNKLKIWRKHLLNTAKKVDKCNVKNMECTKLYAINIKSFNSAMKDFRNFYRQGNKFSQDEIEALDIFMEKFQSYHTKNVKETEQYIKRSCKSEYLNDCKVIQSTIFDAYITAFNTTFMDMYDTISKINGELTGLKINGVTIGGLYQLEES